ncbi:MAG TPA: hypothetical protein VI078_17570 [bacterium]
MGHTRVIYTDATTAEAASALKSSGFLESSQGGIFTSPSSQLKIYVVWGKSAYYPEILALLGFSPRVQIHIKGREDGPDLAELAIATAHNLRGICPSTVVRIFNADARTEIDC